MAKIKVESVPEVSELAEIVGVDSNNKWAKMKGAGVTATAIKQAQSDAASAVSTANTAKSTADTAKTTADAALPKGGGTMTGSLILKGAPTQNNEAATKAYVDSKAGGSGSGDYLPLTGGVVNGELRVVKRLNVGAATSQFNKYRNEITLINPNAAPVELILGADNKAYYNLTVRNAADGPNPCGIGLYNNILGKYAFHLDKDNKCFYVGGLNADSKTNLYVNGDTLSVGDGSLVFTFKGGGTKFLSDDGTYKAAGGSALAAFRSFDGSMYASTGLSIDRSSAGVYNVSASRLTTYAPSVSILAGQAGFIVIYLFSASIIQIRTFNISGQPYDMGFYCVLTPTNIAFK